MNTLKAPTWFLMVAATTLRRRRVLEPAVVILETNSVFGLEFAASLEPIGVVQNVGLPTVTDGLINDHRRPFEIV